MATARLLVLTCVLALLAFDALAAVTFPTPGGWSTRADAGARRRAKDWANNAGGRLVKVMTTREADDYREVLALIEVDAPLSADALSPRADSPNAASTAALLARARNVLEVDATLEREGRIQLETGVAVLYGQWRVGDEMFALALAPVGRTHVLVVMAVQASAWVLYEPAFGDVLAGLRGAAQPIAPFARRRWLGLGAVGWLVVFGLVLLASARAGTHPAPTVVGTRSAWALVALSSLVGATSYGSLVANTAGLAAAGTSPSGMAAQLAGTGLLLAVTARIGGAVWQWRFPPVSSAPSVGAFAPRPRPPAGTAAPLPPDPSVVAIDLPAERSGNFPAKPATLEIEQILVDRDPPRPAGPARQPPD